MCILRSQSFIVVQVKKGLLLLLKEEIFLLLLLPSLLCFSIEYNKAIKNYTKFDDWYLWVQMYKGTVSMPVFQSLEAYWPGLQVRAVIPYGDFVDLFLIQKSLIEPSSVLL